MIERRERDDPTSSDVFDYITPGVARKDWPSSIREVNKIIKDKLAIGRSVALYLAGPPASAKTTTLRRMLIEIDPRLITPPLEWGTITGSKSLDSPEKLKSATKLQGWKVLLSIDNPEARLVSAESPLFTSFPEGDRIMQRTSDRGLTTLMRLARRSGFYSDSDFDLIVVALFAKPQMEYAMKITRGMIADRPRDADRTRTILEEKGADTSDLSDEEIIRYAEECADTDAIEGIDEQIDDVVFKLVARGIIIMDRDRYVNDRYYRLQILTKQFAPALFGSLGRSETGMGENIFFIGEVERAEKIKMHPLRLS